LRRLGETLGLVFIHKFSSWSLPSLACGIIHCHGRSRVSPSYPPLPACPSWLWCTRARPMLVFLLLM
jgi:hypothetical protein